LGEGPPLKLEKLPKPPKARHLLGPGIILAAMGIGMGEMVMWPRMALMWGPGVLWLALIGFTIQYFVQKEMSRWVTATGESFFLALLRQRPHHILLAGMDRDSRADTQLRSG